MRNKLGCTVAVLLLFVACLSFLVIETEARERVLIYINKNELICDFTIIDDHVYVPVRSVAEAMGAEVSWDENSQVINIDSNIKLLASIPEEKTYLYAINTDDSILYNTMILSVKGVNKIYPWENLSLPSPVAFPQLYYTDLNNDNKKELVVILAKNTGTGVSVKEIHVLDLENFNEYKIEDPVDVITDNIEISIITTKKVEIKIDDNVAVIDINNVPFNQLGYYPDTISEIYYKDYIKYELINEGDILKAIVGAEAAHMKYVGNFDIYYSFKNGEFKANKIVFSSPAFMGVELQKKLY